VFKRGFKSWCEETSLQFRKQLRVSALGPLDPFQLAGHLGVVLKTPHDFPKLANATRAHLLGEGAACWSAFTITSGRRPLIVYNPTHSPARNASDLMHELAHIILGHRPAKMFLSAGASGIPLRSHDREQEDEAAWLAGCLLLPRPALLAIGKGRMPQSEACAKFGVSHDLLNYRLNVSGVNVQLRRGRAY
jgi:Zn-dependent peptidase ImmA (M78 family)